jgi:FAD:protein FMN transferase
MEYEASGVSRRDLLTLTPPPSAARSDYWIRIHRTAMACRFEVTLASGDERHLGAAHAALDEVDRIEDALTWFRPASALSVLNRTAAAEPVKVHEDLFGLLGLARDLHGRTEGAFDVTSAPLSRCWGFMRREGRLPARREIAAARASVGMDGVTLDAARRTVHFLRPGMELNLGSIGKGYALQRIAALLAARGVRHALLSAGGSSVVALGGRGAGWTVDLRSRQAGRDRLARLHLRNAALATSGAGEQSFEVDGTRYGHVIDPRTGWPASGVLSASVVTSDGATADALATAFLVGGVDLARRYCAAHAGTLAFVTPEGGEGRPLVFGACAGATVEGS